jgi:hypothetical protein
MHLTLKNEATRPAASNVLQQQGQAVIAHCICYQRCKINVSQVFGGQKVGVKQVADHIWLVTFMDYDLGYFDDETCRLEPIDNPFGPKLLPMSPE